MSETNDTKPVLQAKPIFEDKKAKGVVNGDAFNFFYHVESETEYDGRKIDFFHLRKPKLRNLRGCNVSVGETMTAVQMANIVKACCHRIVDIDDEEFPSSKKQQAMDELYSDDLFAVAKECTGRFFSRENG